MKASLSRNAFLIVMGFATGALAQPAAVPAPTSNLAALAAAAIPALQQRADGGDEHAQCAILQLYDTGQAKPRPSDDLAAMHRTCAKLGYESSGQPPPPGLPITSRTPGQSVSAAFPFAGFYSAKHFATVEGSRLEVEAYVEIDDYGLVTAYAPKEIGRPANDTCFVLSKGQSVNAAIQGKRLSPGMAPAGQPDYEIIAGDNVFGLIDAEPDGKLRWFVHSQSRNNTANILGDQSSVLFSGATFSITGPPLKPAEVRKVMARMCKDA